MKKNVILFLLLGFTAFLTAQVYIPRTKPLFIPQHDFRIGIGAVLFENFPTSDIFYSSGSTNKIIDFNSINFYKGMVYTNGIFTVNYTYQASQKLGIGITSSCVNYYNDILDAESSEKIGKGSRIGFALYPLLRYTWWQIHDVTFYSEIGLGYYMSNDFETLNGEKKIYASNSVSGQLTLLGISFGKQMYIYSNILGVGNSGYMGIGLGYHLNVKK